jgi:hypothetical protein
MRISNIVVLILVTGCASVLPMKHEFKSHETFPIPFNDVWKLSSNFLETKVSAIDTADKKTGFLKTKEFTVPYSGFQYQSKYADCGKLGGLNVYHEIVGYYEIFISESDENRTTVRTVPHYRASLWSGKEFKGWVPCQSRGYVEQLLIDDLRTQVKESRPKKPLGQQLESGVDKESDKKSETPTLKIQENDNKGSAKPDINLVPETELKTLRIKYENALQENEKLNKEITQLKRNKINENNEKNPEEAELSIKESPPELTIKPDNDVTNKLLLNKEDSLAAEPLIQEKDDNTQIFTIQTGSFLDIDLAREHIVLITVQLEGKDYSNLRIEKIGDLYIVRLGKFENYETAKIFLQEVKPRLSEAIILKDHMNDERIIKLYK